MKNLIDCINVNEEWTGVDNKSAFKFTANKKFAPDYDVFDNVRELEEFFEDFLLLSHENRKASVYIINSLGKLSGGFEDAANDVKDEQLKKIYKDMSLAIANTGINLYQRYTRDKK